MMNKYRRSEELDIPTIVQEVCALELEKLAVIDERLRKEAARGNAR